MFLFLVFWRTMTTCPDLGETPVSSTLDTCLLSLPVNGLPSEKERLCMSRSDSQNHPTPSSSHTTSGKRRSHDVTEARAHAQRAKLETQIQQRQSKEEDIRPTKKPK